MWYFGYSRYPAKVRLRRISRLASSAFPSPAGKARKRVSNSCSFFQAFCRPCSKRRSPAPGSKFLGGGLRERVDRVLLAQPLLQLVVELPGGLHRRHDPLAASRLKQDPPQLLNVREDEVEAFGPGLRPE